MGKTVNSHKNSRENTEKVLKTLFETQNTRFSQLKWVANKLPGLATKTLKDKIVKNLLCVFRDWKIYPQGSRELSRKNFCVPLAIGPFTHEQVVKINTQTRCWSMQLGWPATELPEKGNTVFWNFSVFVKTNYFPKTPKTLKKICIWIKKDWACENTF